jgi:hypothetical protein
LIFSNQQLGEEQQESSNKKLDFVVFSHLFQAPVITLLALRTMLPYAADERGHWPPSETERRVTDTLPPDPCQRSKVSFCRQPALDMCHAAAALCKVENWCSLPLY